MTFSIMYWNIWQYSQINGESGINELNNQTGAKRLLDELGQLIDQHKPDFIGLNEAVYSKDKKASFVIEFLKQRGYKYAHHAPSGPYNDNCIIGVALCSRIKIDALEEIPISNNSYVARRGYPGFKLKALAAQVTLPKGPIIKIIVAHAMPWASLRSDSLVDHYISTGNIEQIMRSDKYSSNTVLGGDINESGFMPKALARRVADIVHHRTGTILKPTWYWNARRFTPVRTNLDHLYWSRQSQFTLKDFGVLPMQSSV